MVDWLTPSLKLHTLIHLGSWLPHHDWLDNPLFNLDPPLLGWPNYPLSTWIKAHLAVIRRHVFRQLIHASLSYWHGFLILATHFDMKFYLHNESHGEIGLARAKASPDHFFRIRTKFFGIFWSGGTNFPGILVPRTKIFAGPKFPWLYIPDLAYIRARGNTEATYEVYVTSTDWQVVYVTQTNTREVYVTRTNWISPTRNSKCATVTRTVHQNVYVTSTQVQTVIRYVKPTPRPTEKPICPYTYPAGYKDGRRSSYWTPLFMSDKDYMKGYFEGFYDYTPYCISSQRLSF